MKRLIRRILLCVLSPERIDKMYTYLFSPKDIRGDIFKSYFRLRRGLAVLSILFPAGLLFLGWWYGINRQNSMSAYYFAQSSVDALKYSFPMRAWFVGILWAVGVFLILYKGFSRTESWLLNLAGISAIFVALFPMTIDMKTCLQCGVNDYDWVHYYAAGTLFGCIGIVAWACTDETLVELSGWKRTLLRGAYTVLAWAMWVVPYAFYYWISGGEKNTPAIYGAEFAGAVIFSCYWWCKTIELDALGTQEMRLKSGTGLPSLSGTGLPSTARHAVGRMFD